MNTLRPMLLANALFVAAFILQTSSFCLAQGLLTPPSAPAPTMKTLDQVEPRTAITSLPLVISQPGSYYLTKSFAQNFTGSDALTIRADNVTVDFSGFSIVQTGTTAALSGVLIGATSINTPLRNAVLKNGTIAGFAALGVIARGGRNCLIENLHITQCASGINFQAFGTAGAAGNTFRRCKTTDNGSVGILLSGGVANIGNFIENCESLNNVTGFAIQASGNLIIGCRASGNTGFNYTIAAGNRGGAIILPTANVAAFNGSTGGLGSGTTDPFANLSY